MPAKMKGCRDIIVRPRFGPPWAATAQFGPLIFTCAIGRTGTTASKREGDSATPIGRWPVRRLYYRGDRQRGFFCSRIFGWGRPIRIEDGWCDGVGDRNYNRGIRHPYPASAEHLWRTDHLYDVILELGYNDNPRVQGRGSAIFLHVANLDENGDLKPTAGCVALRRRDLAVVLSRLTPATCVRVVA